MLAARNFIQALSSYDERHNNGINISHPQGRFQIYSKIYRHKKATVNYQYVFRKIILKISFLMKYHNF